ncbi:hypothetical protein [Beijerinckia sp. L45]|uniref:hypothetical protein n=1 Tax=Beijerinckia sp. L45 TaxID=1641855 RepID=UPI00131BB83A|nr:hypothetical protein [Beijerinckia sp. L45]
MSDIRFRLIDASIREAHSRLTEDDKCLFLFEKTSRRDYLFSETNNLISNLKKKPSQRQAATYKTRAIEQCAAQMRAALDPAWLSSATLVPIPPSKAIGHVDYDDRVEQICRRMGHNIDVRALVKQTTSMNAAHESSIRPTVAELVASYVIDEGLTVPEPSAIGIVDDVLTAGTHFKAMQQVLSRRFPRVALYGFFVARRIFPDEDPTSSFGSIGE